MEAQSEENTRRVVTHTRLKSIIVVTAAALEPPIVRVAASHSV